MARSDKIIYTIISLYIVVTFAIALMVNSYKYTNSLFDIFYIMNILLCSFTFLLCIGMSMQVYHNLNTSQRNLCIIFLILILGTTSLSIYFSVKAKQEFDSLPDPLDPDNRKMFLDLYQFKTFPCFLANILAVYIFFIIFEKMN